jgi:hypothetical protein
MIDFQKLDKFEMLDEKRDQSTARENESVADEHRDHCFPRTP